MKVTGKGNKNPAASPAKKVYGPGRRKGKGKADTSGAVAEAEVPFEQSEAEKDLEVVRVEVLTVEKFQGGFVHPALDGAVNSHWRRSEETNLLYGLMSKSLTLDGVYVGDIVSKPSFITKSGGAALL